MKEKPFFITTPIYYVNDVPHIGHAYTTIAADVVARYKRLSGHDVRFLTGTDEHGQKVQQAAGQSGREPQAHVDDLHLRFKELWKRFNISEHDFIRTTEERHKKVVREILQKLYDEGEIYQKNYKGWYCMPDERFWTEKDLVNGNCPECGRKVDQINESNYFFKMSKYQDWLIEHINKTKTLSSPSLAATKSLVSSNNRWKICVFRGPLNACRGVFPCPLLTATMSPMSGSTHSSITSPPSGRLMKSKPAITGLRHTI